MRNLHRFQSRQRRDPDRARAAAVIVSPRHERRVIEAERRRQRRIRNLLPVRRKLPLVRHRQRQRLGNAALRRHFVKLRVAALRNPRRPEHNVLPVRRPRHRKIRRRMIRHAKRHATRRRNREHIRVAVVVAGKRDRAAVGRKHRIASQCPRPSSAASQRRPRAAPSTNLPRIQTQSDPCSTRDAERCAVSWPRVLQPAQQPVQLRSGKQQGKSTTADGTARIGPSGKILQECQHLTACAPDTLFRNIATALKRSRNPHRATRAVPLQSTTARRPAPPPYRPSESATTHKLANPASVTPAR